MARKTKAEALATRSDILDAAIHVFLQRGVAGATLEEIAETAGVTRGAVYWHFKNKLEIFQQLVDEVQATFFESILEDLDRDHPQPLEQLQGRCVQLLRELEQDKRRSNILRILFLRCDYSGDMEPQLLRQGENKEKNLRLFAAYFQRAIDKGHLAAVANPRVLALSLMCYLSGIAFEYFRTNSIKLSTQAEKLIDQFFTGVR